MKSDLIELILNRHSYRGKYKATPVPKEDLALIMATRRRPADISGR